MHCYTFVYIVFETQFIFYTYNKPRLKLGAFLGPSSPVELSALGWTAKSKTKLGLIRRLSLGFQMSPAIPKEDSDHFSWHHSALRSAFYKTPGMPLCSLDNTCFKWGDKKGARSHFSVEWGHVTAKFSGHNCHPSLSGHLSVNPMTMALVSLSSSTSQYGVS